VFFFSSSLWLLRLARVDLRFGARRGVVACGSFVVSWWAASVRDGFGTGLLETLADRCWDTVCSILRARGLDFTAVARDWGLFGCFGWMKLAVCLLCGGFL